MLAVAIFCVALVAITGAAPTGNGTVAAKEWTPEEYLLTLKEDAAIPHFFIDPDHCEQYYLAVKIKGVWVSFSYKCSLGTIWSAQHNACVRGACGKPAVRPACPKDGALLADTENCASFYHCSNGFSYRKCCPVGSAWNDDEKVCDSVPSCTQKPECPTYQMTTLAPTTLGPEPESCINGIYIYAKIEGKAGSYKMTIKATGVVEGDVDCPVHYVFNTHQCGCINPNIVIPVPPKNVCEKLDFNTELSDGKLWVGRSDDGVSLKDEQVCFTGAGYLNIPYYNNMAFKNLQLSFKYSSSSENAVLFTNAPTEEKASFCIYLEKESLKVKIVTDMGTFVVEKKAVAGVVTVKYDGEHLFLTVAKEETKVAATGIIARRQYDLLIGAGFVGCIDDFDFCRPT